MLGRKVKVKKIFDTAPGLLRVGKGKLLGKLSACGEYKNAETRN
jgi:hypothetical protein